MPRSLGRSNALHILRDVTLHWNTAVQLSQVSPRFYWFWLYGMRLSCRFLFDLIGRRSFEKRQRHRRRGWHCVTRLHPGDNPSQQRAGGKTRTQRTLRKNHRATILPLIYRRIKATTSFPMLKMYPSLF